MALRETDIHTGLYTPGFFIAFGARELAFAREARYPVSLMSIRIHRHAEDRAAAENGSTSSALRTLGERIKRETGEGSIVARVASDRIAVLLPGVTLERARKLAEAISAGPGLSIGLASTSNGEIEISELMRQSQEALEIARETGTTPATHPPH
jgi:GGDEF domain-containing protein